MAVTLRELAEFIGARLRGDPECVVERVATLERAQAGEVSFLYNRGYHKYLKITRASAVILAQRFADECPVDALISEDPYLAYAKAATLLHPAPASTQGVHPHAQIDPAADVDGSASIGAFAVVEAGAAIGAEVFVGPHCFIGANAAVGDYSRLYNHVSICHAVSLGRRCIVHPGAVVGADGFGLAKDGERWFKIPQLGSVRVGDDVEIGANSTVDRGTIRDTVIESGVKIDNLVQVAHNVRIGAHTAIAGCVGISGSVSIGRRCMIGGGVGLSGHLDICDDVTITGMSLVTKSIKRPGTYSGGWPAQEAQRWRRGVARFRRLFADPRSQ